MSRFSLIIPLLFSSLAVSACSGEAEADADADTDASSDLTDDGMEPGPDGSGGTESGSGGTSSGSGGAQNAVCTDENAVSVPTTETFMVGDKEITINLTWEYVGTTVERDTWFFEVTDAELLLPGECAGPYVQLGEYEEYRTAGLRFDNGPETPTELLSLPDLDPLMILAVWKTKDDPCNVALSLNAALLRLLNRSQMVCTP